MSKKTVSVVVPCFNEGTVIDETHRRLVEVLDGQQDFAWEVVYVDDGSGDQTWPMVSSFARTLRNVSAVKLSRNFGHQMASMAGLEVATGNAMVLIDADLQDPPALIPEFYSKWIEGYEVVYGKRSRRKGESVFKRLTARVFYRLLNKLSEVEIPLDTGDFRLMDRKVVDRLLAMPERARFLRGMVAWVGFRQCGVDYERDERFAGVSKYPLGKMLKFAADGILSFSTIPLKFATLAGMGTFCLSIAGFLYALGLRLLTDNWVSGWTALFVAVLFFGGLQLLTLGLIGEYLARIYTESKGRPLYIVDDMCGSDVLVDESSNVV